MSTIAPGIPAAIMALASTWCRISSAAAWTDGRAGRAPTGTSTARTVKILAWTEPPVWMTLIPKPDSLVAAQVGGAVPSATWVNRRNFLNPLDDVILMFTFTYFSWTHALWRQSVSQWRYVLEHWPVVHLRVQRRFRGSTLPNGGTTDAHFDGHHIDQLQMVGSSLPG